jgi:hypothetical protein
MGPGKAEELGSRQRKIPQLKSDREHCSNLKASGVLQET